MKMNKFQIKALENVERGVVWDDIYEKHYVRCNACHMQGPEIYGREAAADAWNAIPRRHEITPNADKK